MTKQISITIRGAAAALIAATFMPGVLWAQSDAGQREARNLAVAPAAAVRSGPTRAECDKARSKAWFLSQLEMTDGNIFPPVEPQIRADCRGDGDGAGVDRKVANSVSYGEAADAK